MSDWKNIRLGDIIKTNQSMYSPKENWKFVNYLDTGNITENRVKEIQCFNTDMDKLPSRAKRKVKLGSIIYSTVRPNQLHYGIIKDQLDNFLVSTGFVVIDVNTNEAIPEYIYYVLSQKEIIEHLQAIAEQSVSAYPSIKASDIENLNILIPDIYTQQEVVSIISVLDEKITLNEAINNNLVQQAKTIYQAWFEKFILSEGSCPPTWKRGILADIASITSGKRPHKKSTKKLNGFVIPLVGATSIVGFTDEANYTNKILVIGRVGTHGIVQRINFPCWVSDNTLIITSELYEYTFQILQKINYHAMNRGSTQPLITQADMNKVVILIPDNQILTEFESTVGQLMQKYETNLMENTKLAEIRDYLLPRLMSGELDVSQINI